MWPFPAGGLWVWNWNQWILKKRQGQFNSMYLFIWTVAIQNNKTLSVKIQQKDKFWCLISKIIFVGLNKFFKNCIKGFIIIFYI